MPTAGHCQHLLLLLLLLLLHAILQLAARASPAPAPAADANATAHDHLRLLGLPMGLLPANVISYTGSEDGRFTVELSEPCYVQFSDLAYYGKAVSGKAAYGQISGLSGVQVKKYFFWLDVVRVAAGKDGSSLLFSTRLISETRPASEFRDVRRCQRWREAAPGSGVAAA